MTLPPYRSAVPKSRFPALGPPKAQQALALQFQLSQSQWWPLERIREAQLAQLSIVVRHAAVHSPYWSRVFREAGVNPMAPFTMEALRSLPLLSRHAIQDHMEDMRCATVPKEHGRMGSTQTSGSSGTPVTVYKTELSLLYWRSFTLRDHLWHERDLTAKSCLIRYLPGDDQALPPHGRTVPNWGAPTTDIFETGPACLLSIQTSADAQARWVLTQRPKYLLVYPSGLSDLLDRWEDWGEFPEGLEQVRTISEAVPASLRARCESLTGAKLCDIYSTQEVGYVALQCPEQPHYHLQSESCLTEILREDGTPCEPGEVGRIVVTPLHNLAMPLFRYDIGDMAEVGEPCPCGRGLPVVRRILGRVRGMLRHPDGSTSWPVFGGQYFRDVAPIRQWRVVQPRLDHVDIEVVPELPLTDQQRDALIASARKHSGWTHGLAIIERTEPIGRTKAGKYPDFVCTIPKDDDPLSA